MMAALLVTVSSLVIWEHTESIPLGLYSVQIFHHTAAFLLTLKAVKTEVPYRAFCLHIWSFSKAKLS